MSHTTAGERTSGHVPATATSISTPSTPSEPAGHFPPWVDGEWYLFEAVLFVPALLCLLVGDVHRGAFFARLALLLGVLKWLGWAVLTRPAARPAAHLLFPAELFIGLAIVVAWFYLRNMMAWLVPGSYSLKELGMLPWLVAMPQVAGIAIARARSKPPWPTNWRKVVKALIPRVSLYAVFTLTLTATLWSVAKELFVASMDGWFHSFIARVYLNDGLFYQRFNGGSAIFYLSGFGAMNATTAAISGLSIVKVQNLQHILWAVAGLYLVTTLVAVLARRSLVLLHFVPPLFLSLYPVHNLPPELYWEHTPQQTASPLLVAIPLISLLFPVARRHVLYIAMAAQALLGLLVLALNPTSAVFLPLSWGAALLINCYRARKALGEPAIKVTTVQAGLALAAALLVMGCDRYYSTLLLKPERAAYLGSAQFGGASSAERPRLFSLSPTAGLSALGTAEPLKLLADWPGDDPDEIPWRHLPVLVTFLTGTACALAARRPPAPSRRLAIVALCFAVCGIGVKYVVSFLFAAITDSGGDAVLFRDYLMFLPPRLELWLWFVSAVAAAVSLNVNGRNTRDRISTTAVLGAAVVTLATWWLPFARTRFDLPLNHLVATNPGIFAGRITAGDIELVAWMERHIGRKEGIIGLMSVPMKVREAKLLFPMGAAQALPLYGEQYNFTFQIFDPSREYSFDDYTARVANYFDADWCLQNSIRFFHLPNDAAFNPGLKRAQEIGLLRRVGFASSSGVYAVNPMPWTPAAVAFSGSRTSSNEIAWQADGSGVMTGLDPHVVFTLDEPMFVHAVRFKYRFDNAMHAPAPAQLFWKGPGQHFVEERAANLRLEAGPTEETLTILVHDTLDAFRFDPDVKPGTFTLRDIELLVKPPAVPR